MGQPLVIYHGNCADGFSAAWVARKYFLAIGIEPIFHSGVYGQAPPDCTGKAVYFLDFSYKRNVVEQIVKVADSVIIIDHHKTAEEDLRGLEGVKAVFDMKQSGAMLAWNYWFPTQVPPVLLMHVEDRDLWKFLMPKTREIQACVFSYPYDFETWTELMKAETSELAKEGEAIERKHFKDIKELLQVVVRRMLIGGVNVPVANLPYTFTSDAGNILSVGEKFAACYWDTPTGRVFSLRSQAEGQDVAKIAESYGGGGHKNASGFRVSFEEAQKFEINS